MKCDSNLKEGVNYVNFVNFPGTSANVLYGKGAKTQGKIQNIFPPPNPVHEVHKFTGLLRFELREKTTKIIGMHVNLEKITRKEKDISEWYSYSCEYIELLLTLMRSRGFFVREEIGKMEIRVNFV